jgi:hypothetical protein
MWHLPLLMAHPDGAVPSGRNVAALTMRSCFPVTGTFTWVMEKNGGGGFGGSASAGVNMSAEDFFGLGWNHDGGAYGRCYLVGVILR